MIPTLFPEKDLRFFSTAYRDPSSRRFFLATIVIAAMDLVLFALGGTRL